MSIKPTENQAEFIRSIIENVVTICAGPAGTGKSMWAAKTAISQLHQSQKILAKNPNAQGIKQVVFCRNIVNVGRSIGYYPGGYEEKCEPYFAYMDNYVRKFLDKEYADYIKTEKIKYIPVEMMRGQTYDNSIILVDEVQNLMPIEIKTVLTRIGKNSKICLMGDLKQKDSPSGCENGLEKVIELLTNMHDVGIIRMNTNDIKRNSIIAPILIKFNENGY